MRDLFGLNPTRTRREPDGNFRPSGSPPTSTRRPDGTLVFVSKPTKPNDPSVTGRRVLVGGRGRPKADESQKKDIQQLRAERDLLRLQLADWNQSLDLRRRALAPMQGAFMAAHEEAAWEAECAGPPPRECPAARARVLAAYEKRRKAGMAAHPYRLALAEAERVVRAIRARISEINAELSDVARHV